MFRRRFWIGLVVAVLLLVSLTAVMVLAGDSSPTRSGSSGDPAATPTLNGSLMHLVRRGEMLRMIARQYRVSLRELAAFNRITNPDRIYVGQLLRIPRAAQPTGTPVPLQPVTLTPAVCPCEEIVILAPGPGITVTNPVFVSGIASSPFEQTVVVAVLDGSGGRIGLASAVIAGEYGQRGPFSVTVPIVVPANSQAGRIQIFTESPRDGAVEHLTSLTVMLRGAGLDELLEQLEAAVDAKAYATLESLMGPSFELGLYRFEGALLTPAEMRERLQLSYLGPGLPRLDFSEDARALLESHMALSTDTRHVVYSTGWGPMGDDDAFLLIGDVDGRARWVGMVYVPQALIDYTIPLRPGSE